MPVFEHYDRLKNVTLVPYKDAVKRYKYFYDSSIDCFFRANKDGIDEMFEIHHSLNVSMPEMIYGTHEEYIHMNAQEIVEDACSELGEETLEWISEESIIELQKLLDNWCAEQEDSEIISPDYTIAITLKDIMSNLI